MNDKRSLTPDFALSCGMSHFRLPVAATFHGPVHWTTVFNNARTLAVAEGLVSARVAASPRILRGSPMEFFCWFAFLHDCRRADEDRDPEHGERAAKLVFTLKASGVLQLSDDDAVMLALAIKHHSAGRTSSHPLTAVCWDADRLDLPRVGITRLDTKLFSTRAGAYAAGIVNAR